MFRNHPLLTALAVGYLAVVGWLTLGPQPIELVKAGGVFRLLALFQRHTATAWVTYPAVEFAANVAMFVPIGVLLLLLVGRRRWWAAVLFGVLLSAAIEVAQLFVPGRVTDVRDLVSNSIGAFVGVVAALVITWPAAARRRRESHPRTGGIRVA